MKLSNSLMPSGCLLLVLVLLSACAPTSRYSEKHDSGPKGEIDVSHVPNAVPKVEPRKRAGNKNPYTVLGKTYHLIENEAGYKERGIASWYGNKFHGHKTANGETYDMYAMTAAHKTLPIPSYVRVTHLDNARSVIVRVNDRGPFHKGRIIDLSYAAAKKLGITSAGTGKVEVEIIVPSGTPPPLKAASPEISGDVFLQIGAFSGYGSAKKMFDSVVETINYPVFITESKQGKPIYRVRIGPLGTERDVDWVRNRLKSVDIHQAHIVRK